MKKNKFWFDDINCLFNNTYIIPDRRMIIEEKMNTITRLIIFIFIIILFTEFLELKNNLLFLILSLFIIILYYYKEKIKMNNMKMENKNSIIENYIPPSTFNVNTDLPGRDCRYASRQNYRCFNEGSFKPIENISYNVNTEVINVNHGSYNPNFKAPTDNQRLAGGPNPKTFVPPVIATPAFDIDYWRSNDNVTNSQINEPKNRYNSDSGYDVQNLYKISKYPANYDVPRKQLKKVNSPKHQPQSPSKSPSNEVKENFVFPYEISSKEHNLNHPDSLFNTDFKNNPYFKDKYKENIFTETIAPGNYKINERNEFINSNMGITHAQQFEEDKYEIIEPFENVNQSNVYDPRFSGYGTSYRSYVDKNLGQPRFYYDDVNSIRMPNYITRNAIDVTPFGDSYGQLNEGNEYNSNIYEMADKHYNDSMNNFRTEMQERLMRKINSNQWQQRMYPIHKHSQR